MSNLYITPEIKSQFREGNFACLKAIQHAVSDATEGNVDAAREVIDLANSIENLRTKALSSGLSDERLVEVACEINEKALSLLPEERPRFESQMHQGLRDPEEQTHSYEILRKQCPLFVLSLLQKMPTFYLGAIDPNDAEGSIVELPADVVGHVCDYLPLRDLQALACTNSHNYSLAEYYVPNAKLAKLEKILTRVLPDEVQALLESISSLLVTEQIDLYL